MQQHAVGLRRERAARRLAIAGYIEDPRRFAMRVAHLFGARLLPTACRHGRLRRHALERLDQAVGAAARDRDGLDHRDAELRSEPLAVERVAATAREVAHVERKHHR